MSIESLGWNEHWNELFAPHRDRGWDPARVSGLDRDRCTVLDGRGAEWPAEVAGRLRHEARGPADFPAVGDWVALEAALHKGPRRIAAVLPRAGSLARKVAGEVTEAQVIAANVDTAFLVCGLDHDFNLRRIERYLATAWDGGVTPVVVLNKSDLDAEVEARVAEAEAVSPGVPVIALSALEGRGLEALAPWLAPRRTVALLGSSGAGKSTLANALLGEGRQRTAEVRADDSRGRHTTTRRELLALPGGAWLVDTPGLRELQLWADESALGDSFPEIAALAVSCRFRDCRHEREPGCAVLAALSGGTLPRDRFESWRKLQRELRWLARRQDRKLRAAEEARWREIGRAMKKLKKLDARHGGTRGAGG